MIENLSTAEWGIIVLALARSGYYSLILVGRCRNVKQKVDYALKIYVGIAVYIKHVRLSC